MSKQYHIQPQYHIQQPDASWGFVIHPKRDKHLHTQFTTKNNLLRIARRRASTNHLQTLHADGQCNPFSSTRIFLTRPLLFEKPRGTLEVPGFSLINPSYTDRYALKFKHLLGTNVAKMHISWKSCIEIGAKEFGRMCSNFQAFGPNPKIQTDLDEIWHLLLAKFQEYQSSGLPLQGKKLRNRPVSNRNTVSCQ